MAAQQEERVDAIMDAAFRLFGTKGYYETKMSEIADEAGIAKGTLYLYFQSKEQLFFKMTEREIDRFLIELDAVVEKAETFERKLRSIASHHLFYFYGKRDMTRVFFQVPNNDPELWLEVIRYLKLYEHRVFDVMAEAGVREPELCAKAYMGMLEGYKMDILCKPDFSENDIWRRVDVCVELMLKGLAGLGGGASEQK